MLKMDAKVVKMILAEEAFEPECDGCSVFYEKNNVTVHLIYRVSDDHVQVDYWLNDVAAEVDEDCLQMFKQAAASFCEEEEEIEPDPMLEDNYWNNGVSPKDFY